jgi:hypothetical protein
MEKHLYLMKQNNLYSLQEFHGNCFPRRIELPFERNTDYLSGFSSVRNSSLVEKGSIQVNGRSTVYVGRKPSRLEAGGSGTLFPCEN